MRFSALFITVGVCAALISAPASAYLASNGLVVEPKGEGFFVPYRGKSGARAFWCAAGEYAQLGLGLSPTQTVYRTSEPPRRSGQGIGFSLSPDQSANKTGLVILGAKGGGISIAHARSLCDDALFRFD